jgi:hypothetical protein
MLKCENRCGGSLFCSLRSVFHSFAIYAYLFRISRISACTSCCIDLDMVIGVKWGGWEPLKWAPKPLFRLSLFGPSVLLSQHTHHPLLQAEATTLL